MKNVKSILGIVLLTLLISGCSHQLTITNPDEYYAQTPYINNPVTIGIISPQTQDGERLVGEIVDNLRSIGNMKVISPYTMNANNPVDYVLDFNIQTDYRGDMTNFLISFPGFILLAPTWNGYFYSANMNTKVTITDFNTGEPLLTKAYETKYQCKQSEFDRTWMQGVDWFLTYGLASFIGGIVVTGYDDDITSDFVKGYSQPYGSYIARKVVTLINSM